MKKMAKNENVPLVSYSEALCPPPPYPPITVSLTVKRPFFYDPPKCPKSIKLRGWVGGFYNFGSIVPNVIIF